ncbi:MAG: hypothetical protein B7X06_00630 [Verrucomicrobia bacterium 21-51-4]|nr:MAG: hypothetical protein B7X06_00630 [Verrucomicrobia bacterium 21-51-4]HQU08626.1 NTP transferase domain-containing protein [Opitutales bacterium]
MHNAYAWCCVRAQIFMNVVASIIARLGSKRLPYKNLLPFAGKPLIGHGLDILRQCNRVDRIVVSTESELIARVAMDFGAEVLRRPESLAGDRVPSIPVFQSVVERFPCNIHVNYNINFPLCDPAVIDRAIELVEQDLLAGNPRAEYLSDPVAVWAQSAQCLAQYGDPWAITAKRFEDLRAGAIDIHSEADLLEIYRESQTVVPAGWN